MPALEAQLQLLAALRALLGDAHVLQGEAQQAYELDWRKRYHGRALAVLRPGSTEEVAAIVRLAAQHGVSLVAQGGNTGLVGGGVPDESGTQLLLSMRRLDAIRALDPSNLTMTVEAGCILQNVQAAAADAGLLYPLSLAAEGSCTIGGNLATNAGGTQVLRYGNARELCLGLEVVTAQGQVLHGLGGLRKDNSGYDLRDLFIGSEGTLGIITAATLKLYPAPRSQLCALARCERLDQVVALLALARSLAGPALSGFEIMNRQSLSLVATHLPQLPQPWAPANWTVLLELSDSRDETATQAMLEGLLADAIGQGLVQDAALAQSLAQSRQFWELREAIPLAQSAEGLNLKHDIALPASAMLDFVSRAETALQSAWPGMRLVCFGHLGDGNLHFNVQAPDGTAAADFLREEEPAVNACVYDLVCALGGSISAEHGIGQLKRAELAARKDPVALQLMRQIKMALDPQGLLNPGRVL